MATPSTPESWSALAALISGQDLHGKSQFLELLREPLSRTKCEDYFVWPASDRPAAKASTQTLVQYQVVYSITSPLTTGIPPSSKRFRKR